MREPADRRARNVRVREAAGAVFAGRAEARLLDLGCGSGANLRALAPFLPTRQSWRLVDHDPALLDAARQALTGWADRHRNLPAGRLSLQKGAAQIEIAFVEADLAGDYERVLDANFDLVTAASFFDLVSAPWIGRFAAALASRSLPLYAALTYDGVERWQPTHEADTAMLAAFRAHQGGDKGFGQAAGPGAMAALNGAFAGHGWKVVTGSSPWLLGPPDAALIAALAEGSAQAVRETGRVAETDIASWLAARRAASGCEIGHVDLLARPVA